MKKPFSRLQILVGILLVLSLFFIGTNFTKVASWTQTTTLQKYGVGGIFSWLSVFNQFIPQQTQSTKTVPVGSVCGLKDKAGKCDSSVFNDCGPGKVCNPTSCRCAEVSTNITPINPKIDGYCKDKKCVMGVDPDTGKTNCPTSAKDCTQPNSQPVGADPIVSCATKPNTCQNPNACLQNTTNKQCNPFNCNCGVPKKLGDSCVDSKKQQIAVCGAGLMCSPTTGKCIQIAPPFHKPPFSNTPSGFACGLGQGGLGTCLPYWLASSNSVSPGIPCNPANIGECYGVESGGRCATAADIVKNSNLKKSTCYDSKNEAVTGASCNFNIQCQDVDTGGGICVGSQCVAGEIDPKTGKKLTGTHCTNDMNACKAVVPPPSSWCSVTRTGANDPNPVYQCKEQPKPLFRPTACTDNSECVNFDIPKAMVKICTYTSETVNTIDGVLFKRKNGTGKCVQQEGPLKSGDVPCRAKDDACPFDPTDPKSPFLDKNGNIVN